MRNYNHKTSIKNIIHFLFFNSFILALPLVCCLTTATNAQERFFYVKPTLTTVNISDNSAVSIAGLQFDEIINLSGANTLGITIGREITENLAIEFLGGIPLTTTITGINEFEGVEIGSFQYTPAIITGVYTFFNKAKLKPHLGVGFNHTIILKTTDNAVENLQANNFSSLSLQAGLNYTIARDVDISFYVNRLFGAGTIFNGNVIQGFPEISGAPVTADVDLNILALHLGATYRL